MDTLFLCEKTCVDDFRSAGKNLVFRFDKTSRNASTTTTFAGAELENDVLDVSTPRQNGWKQKDYTRVTMHLLTSKCCGFPEWPSVQPSFSSNDFNYRARFQDPPCDSATLALHTFHDAMLYPW
jgi:hypothetical protein